MKNQRKKYNQALEKLWRRKVLALNLLIFIPILILFPLLMKCSVIKGFVLYLLSFTNNSHYKIAYIEFIGAMIGSLIAIYGALWVQRKSEAKHEINEQKKYARIIYNDLSFAFNDLLEIYRRAGVKSISGTDNVEGFCQKALGVRLYLSPSWISDVAQLGDIISEIDIQTIYKYYGKLIDIDRVLQTNNVTNIKSIYSETIAWFFCDDGTNITIEKSCQRILNELMHVMTK